MFKEFLFQAVASGLAVFAASKLVPGVFVRRDKTVFGIALGFAIANLLCGGLVHFLLALVLSPAILLSFGLVYGLLGWLTNAVLLYITDRLNDDFEIKGLGPLLTTSAFISIASWIVPRFL